MDETENFVKSEFLNYEHEMSSSEYPSRGGVRVQGLVG